MRPHISLGMSQIFRADSIDLNESLLLYSCDYYQELIAKDTEASDLDVSSYSETFFEVTYWKPQ